MINRSSMLGRKRQQPGVVGDTRNVLELIVVEIRGASREESGSGPLCANGSTDFNQQRFFPQ